MVELIGFWDFERYIVLHCSAILFCGRFTAVHVKEVPIAVSSTRSNCRYSGLTFVRYFYVGGWHQHLQHALLAKYLAAPVFLDQTLSLVNPSRYLLGECMCPASLNTQPLYFLLKLNFSLWLCFLNTAILLFQRPTWVIRDAEVDFGPFKICQLLRRSFL